DRGARSRRRRGGDAAPPRERPKPYRRLREGTLSLAVHTPDSVAGVLAALEEGGVVLAGGTHVMPRINTGVTGVTALVSLRRAGLAGVEMLDETTVRVGAATTLTQLADAPALALLRSHLDAI